MNRMQPSPPLKVQQHLMNADPNFGRRRILALLIGSMFLPTLAHAAPTAAESLAGKKFMALSLFATGRSKLDPQLGASLLAALRESDGSFVPIAKALTADAASGEYPDVEALESAIRGTPKHAALLALISAWYTGTVSIAGKPRFVTLSGALMYQPIADGSHVPGTCAGGTNSWAQLPYPALSDIPPL